MQKYMSICHLFLKQVFDTTDGTQHIGGLIRQIDGLVLLTGGDLLQGLDVLHCKQIVHRICTATGDGFGDVADGSGFGFGLEDLGASFTLGLQNIGLLVGFSGIDLSLLLTF